jgi:type IV secretory pathway VirD2 relaxase
MGDLRDFTRRLMAQMEQDLETQLDWVAVDHHNTGHPHTHVMLRGITDDGKILNIAGDYIAHGIRARASELVTLELGPQSEWEVQQKLRLEVGEERLTRLDHVLMQEANEEGLIDLGPAASSPTWPAQTARHSGTGSRSSSDWALPLTSRSRVAGRSRPRSSRPSSGWASAPRSLAP